VATGLVRVFGEAAFGVDDEDDEQEHAEVDLADAEFVKVVEASGR
jgi:hypothetical protein